MTRRRSKKKKITKEGEDWTQSKSKKNYIIRRKEMIKEMNRLLIERGRTNNDIRKLTKEMRSWDNILVNLL